MTIGQRIAQKRKELGLSQEGLGERLGVSRQAIYKWESDATLPEIEKLIALSRIFSVSVGWLLGEETQEADPEERELTEEQLNMVQEIVDRYLAAQPKPEPPGRRRWPWVLGAVAALVVIVAFVNLFDRMDRVTQNYNSLQSSINNISSSVNSQIGTMANRVEEILNSQNKLTAEWTTEISSMDPAANTVTFRVRVVPKTYRDGMTALFVARSQGTSTQTAVDVGADGAFEGEITCELTDDIDLTVVFVTDGQRETQVLDEWQYLYSDSFPDIAVCSSLWMEERDGVIPADEILKEQMMEDWDRVYGGSRAVEIRMGLFRDQKLVMWYREENRTVMYNGERQEMPHYIRDRDVTLEPGSFYCEAAVVTDEYGRVCVYADAPIEYNADRGCIQVDSWAYGPLSPEGWEF